ncbi:3-hydroxyacyl-CoA dehydrogenase family protein [Streptomyces sp. OspMP-M43]|uniref:3-hydroxyacyl-CoA dehydrogenase family protein n=1 Tax=Streptomyces sp. OspMP-M43 TaxID=1839781 RepID=UPI00081B64A5|nr:3-hydroxyacyl-CoA dehydrogenase family protein [Streptomyces sp. OspMP-M43]SCE55409.1 3-hydroxybutyryl-CoA dehydrogenase [Streptomyces sp. OspMP-M43]
MGESKNSDPLDTSGAPVGIVGAGTMGVGVAQCFAAAGHPVVVVDPDPAARASGPDRVRSWTRAVQLLRGQDKGPVEQRVVWAADLAALTGVRLVVDCAPERVPVKEEIFRTLDQICPADAVFASCTSAIPIGHLGSVTGRPERVIGTHFMNPAPLKDTVEVATNPATADQTVQLVLDVLAGLGKKAVVVGDGPGFVSNRVLMLTVNEAAAVVEAGTADAATVDRVFQDCFGHATGPLRTADLIGLDTVVDTLAVLGRFTGDARFRPTPLLARLVAEGNVGRKAGRGFHPYPSNRSLVPPRPAGADTHV